MLLRILHILFIYYQKSVSSLYVSGPILCTNASLVNAIDAALYFVPSWWRQRFRHPTNSLYVIERTKAGFFFFLPQLVLICFYLTSAVVQLGTKIKHRLRPQKDLKNLWLYDKTSTTLIRIHGQRYSVLGASVMSSRLYVFTDI